MGIAYFSPLNGFKNIKILKHGPTLTVLCRYFPVSYYNQIC